MQITDNESRERRGFLNEDTSLYQTHTSLQDQ